MFEGLPSPQICGDSNSGPSFSTCDGPVSVCMPCCLVTEACGEEHVASRLQACRPGSLARLDLK